MNNPFLIGERIYLRPLDEDDLGRCTRWINDPEVTAGLTMRFPKNAAREREWLTAQYGDQHNVLLGIVLRDGDRHIGNCGLHRIDWINRSAVFGIMIGEKSEWNKGYGTEAARLLISYGFYQLGLHRVELQVYAYNGRARRAYEKLGFVHEGTLREARFHAGRYHDILIMGILKSEWQDSGTADLK